MKKIVWYLPAIIYTIAIVILNIVFRIFTPVWCVWCVLLWLSGFLLDKKKVWGSILGLLPAIHLLYMSTKYTGQVINIELPLGIFTAIYVLMCGAFVLKKQTQR